MWKENDLIYRVEKETIVIKQMNKQDEMNKDELRKASRFELRNTI
jgi:hypothetical protein